jgi:hypothetical protein
VSTFTVMFCREPNDYTVVSATDLCYLEKEVDLMIENNYEPFGNLVIRDRLFYQPMIRYKDRMTDEE